ncbi:hypothetical protein HKD37_05G013031 [Glycine soja]
MAHTKKIDQMTSEVAKEIADRIDSLEEQASQESFFIYGCQDVLTAAIGRPKHPGRVHAVEAGVTIKNYFGPASRGSHTSSSMGLALPPEVEVGPSAARVSTKKSCVDPSRHDPETGDSDKCGLYVDDNPPRLLFLKPLQASWDTSVFGVYNDNFTLYIKHEDLSKIAHGGQCLSISIIQLWILHMTKTTMRVGNVDVYGFLEPQSIQRFRQSQFELEDYIKKWMQNSQRDMYLGAYLNGTLKGFNDSQGSKSKVAARWIIVKCNKQKGSIECRYYVMHWMSTIILGGFKDNWEMYFTNKRPLDQERMKVIHIQWGRYYLKVKNQTLGL